MPSVTTADFIESTLPPGADPRYVLFGRYLYRAGRMVGRVDAMHHEVVINGDPFRTSRRLTPLNRKYAIVLDYEPTIGPAP